MGLLFRHEGSTLRCVSPYSCLLLRFEARVVRSHVSPVRTAFVTTRVPSEQHLDAGAAVGELLLLPRTDVGGASRLHVHGVLAGQARQLGAGVHTCESDTAINRVACGVWRDLIPGELTWSTRRLISVPTSDGSVGSSAVTRSSHPMPLLLSSSPCVLGCRVTCGCTAATGRRFRTRRYRRRVPARAHRVCLVNPIWRRTRHCRTSWTICGSTTSVRCSSRCVAGFCPGLSFVVCVREGELVDSLPLFAPPF